MDPVLKDYRIPIESGFQALLEPLNQGLMLM